MKRRYVTTLIIESDRDTSNWPLGQFALEVTLGRADRGEEPSILDRGPLNMCPCEFGRWSAENRGWDGPFFTFKDLTTGALTVSVRAVCGARFSGAICEACAKVPA